MSRMSKSAWALFLVGQASAHISFSHMPSQIACDIEQGTDGSPDWLANLGITLFALPLVILGPTSGRLSQRLGPFRVGGVGLLVSAVFIFSYGQLPSGEWIFAIGMFQALTNGLTIAAVDCYALAAARQAESKGEGENGFMRGRLVR